MSDHDFPKDHPLHGFETMSTGGQCLALCKQSTICDGGYVLITDWDGCDLPTVERINCLIGFYTPDGEFVASIMVPYQDVLDGKITLHL